MSSVAIILLTALATREILRAVNSEPSTCRYCSSTISPPDLTTTHSYWQGLPFDCHKACKEAGVKREAIDCQTIDADCNDCKHYRRGKLAIKLISHTRKTSGELGEVTHQPNVFIDGHCMKFDRSTLAFPNKFTGRECFEHRRAA